MRLPRALPASAVRRVVCDGCRETFECEAALDDGVGESSPLPVGAVAAPPPPTAAERPAPAPGAEPARAPARPAGSRLPRWLSDPESHAWRYLSIPIAAAAVIGALLLIRGLSDSERHSVSSNAPGASRGGAAGAAGGGGAAAGNGAKADKGSSSSNAPAGSGAASDGGVGSAAKGVQVITGSSFSLTLPPGWHGTKPKNGATFAAAADDGTAEASLFVRRDPGLSFSDFQSLSLAQAHLSAGSVHVKHGGGPGVELVANSSADKPAYHVTLRAAGPYRYYLSTTVDPNASHQGVDGARVIHKTFVPLPSGD